MPGKQARVLCPVCQEPIPPDETECENCGAFVIDEAVVRLSRALGLDREAALKLFDAGFRHPAQLRDKDARRVLEKGEVGLLFICTNCGGFVAAGDPTCPRCAAEFESEPEEPPADEEDILDLVLCRVCGADNPDEAAECEICGEVLREAPASALEAAATAPSPAIPITSVPMVAEPPKVPEKAVDLQEEGKQHLPRATQTSVRDVQDPGSHRTPSHPPAAPVASREPEAVFPSSPSASSGPAAARPAPTAQAPPRTPDALPRPVRPPLAEQKRVPPPPTPTKPPPPPPIPLEFERSHPMPVARKVHRTRRPSAIQAARPISILRKKVRASALPLGLAPETVGALVLAGGAGLLVAGMLQQALVGVGIVALLIGLCAALTAWLARSEAPHPSGSEVGLLAAAVALAMTAAILRDLPPYATTAGVLAAAFPLTWLTRRLIRTPRRILLAIGGGSVLIGNGVLAAQDPSYSMSWPWLIGLIVAMPWPAALAAVEVYRRKSATALRRQVLRAERGIEQREYERSLTEYDRAIAKASRDVPGAEIPWYGKGATLILLGRYEEALAAIDRALDINPRNEVAWVNKGNAMTRLGQLVDALRCFNAAIKVNPLYEVAWNNKGNALARLDKYEEALRCYERALAIDPGYRGAWVNMGFVLTKLGRFEEAASCADHALVLDRRRRPEPA